MWTLFFTDGPVTDYDSAKKSDTARFARFFWAMMDRGVYLPCSQFEAAFDSVLHGEKEVEQTITAAREALAEIAHLRRIAVDLVAFYRGEAADYQGRTLHDIWNWNDRRLEDRHDYIQVLFPLPEPSQFNARAPLLDDAALALASERTT